MPAPLSFSPEVTQPFFTLTDHLRDIRRTFEHHPPDKSDTFEILRTTTQLIRNFLCIPQGWRGLYESPALEITGQIEFRDFVRHDTGEIIRPEEHPEYRFWDASLALPATGLAFEQAYAWRFATHQGFGVPHGPYITFFNPDHFTPANSSAYDPSADAILSPGAEITLIAALGCIIRDLERRGMETLRRETAYKAAVLHQTAADHPLLEPVTDRLLRSQTLLVLRTSPNDANALSNYLSQFRLLPGRRENIFSFTNYPTHSKESAEMLADCLAAFSKPQ